MKMISTRQPRTRPTPFQLEPALPRGREVAVMIMIVIVMIVIVKS